jgi:hypothetical protein
MHVKNKINQSTEYYLVSLGLQSVLFLELFNLFLQQPDLSGMLLFEGVEFIPQLDVLVNLLANLVIFLLQLVEPVFDSSELVRLLPRAVGQLLPNIRITIRQDQAS